MGDVHCVSFFLALFRMLQSHGNSAAGLSLGNKIVLRGNWVMFKGYCTEIDFHGKEQIPFPEFLRKK